MALSSIQINQIIANHANDVEQFKKYERYYEGNNVTIQDKRAKAEPDKRVSLAFGHKIVKTFTGYEFKPNLITYTEERGENKNNSEFYNILTEIFDKNDEPLTNTECAEIMLAKGKAYKLFYIEEGEINFVVVDPENIVIEWSNDIKPKMLKAYYYYTTSEINDSGVVENTVYFYEYDDKIITSYTSKDGQAFEKKGEKEHFIGIVPVIEFIGNKNKKSVFSHIKNLIDEIDELFSTNVANEHASIGNAILLMSKFLDNTVKDENGITEYDRFMNAANKVLDGMSKTDGDYAEWLTKNVQWEGVFGAIDRLISQMYDLSGIVNFNDPQLFGNAEAGVALAYKLVPFENQAALIESYFRRSLRLQIDMIVRMLKSSTKQDYTEDAKNIVINFERNLPKNKIEAVQLAQSISTIAGQMEALKILDKADVIESAADTYETAKNEIRDLETV